MDSFWESALPILGSILATVLSIGIPWALALFSKWTGIKTEDKHRQVLHSALLTGASWAVARFGGNAAQNLTAIIQYARQSAPDAFKALNPSNDVLEKIAAAKVEQVVNPNVSPTIT
ncbi:MAG TPA: hypothetical protein VEC99_15075 [Clostridia bacterium]|nr:hypothetical protein [Clostridia bacterium]